MKKVFLSSTLLDLSPHREVAREVIEQSGMQCVRIESPTRFDIPVTERLVAALSGCDLVVFLIGHFFGSSTESGQSFTESEYEAAVRLEKPRLVFLAKEDSTSPNDQSENDERRRRQYDFRQRLSQKTLVEVFSSEDDLRERLRAALLLWEHSDTAPQSRPRNLTSIDQFSQSFPSEAVLRKSIQGLLSRMPGTQEVRLTHGAVERGMDLTFFSSGPLGERILSACIVKNSPFRGKDQTQARANVLLHQAQEAFNAPYIEPDGNSILVSRVYVMSPFPMPPRVVELIASRLRDRAGQIEFLDGPRLFDLFVRYWPDFFDSIDRLRLSGPPANKPARLFISYSHKDENLCSELRTHLKILGNSERIQTSLITGMESGVAWSTRVEDEIEKADIILLLITPDFLASEQIHQMEIKRAIERHERGETLLIPIVARASDWRSTEIARFQALPINDVPVSSWRDRDAAWSSVIEGVRAAIRQARTGAQPKATLAISKVHLENIRCFSALTLDLSDTKFCLILGENGLGKSTILRSIALCLCPETKAAALLEALPGDFLKDGEAKGSVTIELTDNKGTRSKCKITLERNISEADGPYDQKPDSTLTLRREDDVVFPQEAVFLCGYGAGRRSIGTTDPASDYQVDLATKTLVDYSSPLQNPELILRRMASLGRSVREIMLKIDAALDLEPGSTTLDSAGVKVRGPWGSFMPVGALGDGYQNTLAWLLDFFGHQLLFDKDCPLANLSGIVLIDELEQHLHPRWQRTIVETLQRQFPKVQFLATSHSPICAGGLADLDAGAHSRLYVIHATNASPTATDTPIPVGMRYDQIMTSPIVGLDIARDSTTTQYLADLRDAYAAPADDSEKQKRIEKAVKRLSDRSLTAADDEQARQAEAEILSSLAEIKMRMGLGGRS